LPEEYGSGSAQLSALAFPCKRKAPVELADSTGSAARNVAVVLTAIWNTPNRLAEILRRDRRRAVITDSSGQADHAIAGASHGNSGNGGAGTATIVTNTS
jgi:hypothetical protein